VMNDKRPPRRPTHVELNPIRPQLERKPEGLRRVLRSRPRGAPMSKYKRPCHAHNLVPRSDPMGAFVVNHNNRGLTRAARV
jgi:hypothetical protein